MDQALNELNIKDLEFGYVHAVSGPGKISIKFHFSFADDIPVFVLGCLVIICITTVFTLACFSKCSFFQFILIQLLRRII